jgi:AraC-like DNA-binding protein
MSICNSIWNLFGAGIKFSNIAKPPARQTVKKLKETPENRLNDNDAPVGTPDSNKNNLVFSQTPVSGHCRASVQTSAVEQKMNFKTINPDKSISLFVKNILVFEETETNQKTVLPFFADGYPGLIFHDTENGLLVNPHNKQMPILFLYGQTIKPIELVLKGSYKLIVFQLHPFVLKSFFNVTAKEINDDCYDLQQLENADKLIQNLSQSSKCENRIEILSFFLADIFKTKKETLDLQIRQAIHTIIEKKGQNSIKEVSAKVHLTERTFERRFFNVVGLTAKQFSKIIQFQLSLEQLTVKDYTKLTDIVYANGFADQSHFIKVFKAFTGKTPLAFKSQK